MPEIRMRVAKYLPEKLYGFCQDDSGTEVFFHLAVFHPGPDIVSTRCLQCQGPPHCAVSPQAPPPILGEWVEVAFDESPSLQPGKAPRASRVNRIQSPQMLIGTVESFDPVRRYGFVRGSDDVSYHLHQSEIVDGRLPLAGNHITFFAGMRENRPRACHVRVCR